ncbi:MAG: hypothetical protein JWQ09_2208 [Segetibacter sp.]|nr:hypothetical protein [Segetibacter sp.]
MSIEDPTPEEIDKAGRLDQISAELKSEFDRSREYETKSIDELEKTLWLANSGAATITIGFLTSSNQPNLFQFYGCSAFVFAIILLLLMKIVSAINASRDRNRRQDFSDKFFTQNKPISSMSKIRDKHYNRLKNSYLLLKSLSICLFLAGCIATLISIYPQINNSATHNKALKAQPSAAGTPQSGAL